MNPNEQGATIKDRLGAMVGAILQNSRFNPAFIPVIRNLIKKFMEESTDEDLERGIEELRDRYIPWVLTGQMPQEPTNQPTDENFMQLAREHYWDTLEPQKDLILQHIKSLQIMNNAGYVAIEAHDENPPQEQ